MAPTATDYAHGLRRLWWVPLITLLVGLGLGLLTATQARPTTVTTGHALFTFQVADAGSDSAGSARGAEASVAQSRLRAYVQLSRSSEQVREILESGGILGQPTALSPTGTFEDASARALIAASSDTAPGLVEIRVKNGSLSQTDADQIVNDLSRVLVEQVTATDAQQASPSLQPDALITQPQAKVEGIPTLSKAFLPVILLFTLGLGLVYVLVRRQGGIYGRRDIEDRLGARVLGDLTGRAADAPAIALALGKGREAGTTALLVPASPRPSSNTTGAAQAVTAGAQSVGLTVTHTPIGSGRAPQDSVTLPDAAPAPAEPDASPTASLTLMDASAGLDAGSLRAAASVDIVVLVVEYGRTSYLELAAAGQTLAEVTGAEITVIGVQRSAKV